MFGMFMVVTLVTGRRDVADVGKAPKASRDEVIPLELVGLASTVGASKVKGLPCSQPAVTVPDTGAVLALQGNQVLESKAIATHAAPTLVTLVLEWVTALCTVTGYQTTSGQRAPMHSRPIAEILPLLGLVALWANVVIVRSKRVLKLLLAYLAHSLDDRADGCGTTIGAALRITTTPTGELKDLTTILAGRAKNITDMRPGRSGISTTGTGMTVWSSLSRIDACKQVLAEYAHRFDSITSLVVRHFTLSCRLQGRP